MRQKHHLHQIRQLLQGYVPELSGQKSLGSNYNHLWVLDVVYEFEYTACIKLPCLTSNAQRILNETNFGVSVTQVRKTIY